MAQGKKRRRVKPRFFVFLAILLALAGGGVLLVSSLLNANKVEWGMLETNRSVTAIVIHDEQLVYVDSYARLNCLVAEGELVEAGTPVAELYSAGYSEKDLANLITLQKSIKEYQLNNILKNIVDPPLEELNTQVSTALEAVSLATDNHQLQELPVLERNLYQLMEQRRTYLRTTVAPDDQLNTLYQQEAELMEKINSFKQTLALNQSALISFFLDGYEADFNMEKLSTLTVAKVEGAVKSLTTSGALGGAATAGSGSKALLRAVNSAHWFMAFSVPAGQHALVQGNYAEVTLEGYDQLINAYVTSVSNEGKNDLVILEIPTSPGAMLRVRKITAHLGRNAEGYRVPLAALTGDTITLRGDGGRQTIQVTVVASNQTHAIVLPVNADDRITVGQRLVMP